MMRMGVRCLLDFEQVMIRAAEFWISWSLWRSIDFVMKHNLETIQIEITLANPKLHVWFVVTFFLILIQELA